MTKAQLIIDGIPVDAVKGRFTGTVDLEPQEADASTLDGTAVWVLITRSGTANFRVDKKGEVQRVNVYTVGEARMPDAELRDAILRQMGMLLDDLFTFPVPAEQQKFPEPATVVPPAGTDPETGELPDEQSDPELAEWVEAQDRTEPPVLTGGPKVARFNPDDLGDIADGPSDREVVGHIGGHRDPALASFIDNA